LATTKSATLGGSPEGVAAAVRSGSSLRAQRAAFLLLILGNLLWAGTYVTGKIALEQLSPIELNSLRFSLAALVLLPVVIRGWRQIPRDRHSLILLAQIVLMGWVLNKTLEYIGLALSTASDVALLIATESLFTAILSWLFLRERVTSVSILALAIGLSGAYLIVERGLIPSLGGSSSNTLRIIGDLLVIGSLILEAGYTIRGKTALSRLSLPPLLLTSATLAGSTLVWVPAGAIAVWQAGLPSLSLAGWLSVLYMAIGSSVLGYWLWFHGLGVLDASVAAPTLFVQPLVGAALGVLLLHDPVTWPTILGSGLIGFSLLLVIMGTRRGSSPVLVEDFTP
jgi:drug/metabolite transporter (DMT)-like permease